MNIKFIDKEGSQSVATIPEGDIDYKTGKDPEETFYVYAKIPHARLRHQPSEKRLAESLDKATADKCIEEIYNQLTNNNNYCDLVPIQLGELTDISKTEDDNNE